MYIYIYIYLYVGIDYGEVHLINDATLNSLDGLDDFLNNLIDEEDSQTKKVLEQDV
jgi:hypothetical protein